MEKRIVKIHSEKTAFGASLLLYLSLAAGLSASGQDTLPEVRVMASRWTEFPTGANVLDLDTITLQFYKNNSLTELLSDQSGAFIRNYGPGQLASLSVRGTAAPHTAILWNGFNIQSPMLGQYDLSLLPVAAFDQVAVQYGGASAMFGSGAVGGVVYLNNKPVYGNGLRISANAQRGSFESGRESATLEYSAKKWMTKTSWMNAYAGNEFPFVNIYKKGFPTQTQTHSATKNQTILQDLGIRLGRFGSFEFNGWYSKNHREIPPYMTEAGSVAEQWDEMLRVAGKYSFTGRKFSYTWRNAFFEETIRYRNPLIDIDSRNSVRTLISEMDGNWLIGHGHQLSFGLNHTRNIGLVPDYINPNVIQVRNAVFGTYTYQSKSNKLKSTLSARQEWIDSNTAPMVPGIGLVWSPSKFIGAEGMLNRNYRYPSLNDLYWKEGGNSKLKPENGWSGEISLKGKPVGNENLELVATGYHSLIHDWIMWMPGSPYFTAENTKTVQVSGLETGINMYGKIKKMSIQFSTRFTLSQSINKEHYDGNKKVIGKQLIYTPQYVSTSFLRFSYRRSSIQYQHNFNSWRYITADNSSYLSGYYLSKIMATYCIVRKQISVNIQAHINNLFNESYLVIPNRAMPGRNFQLGLSIEFDQSLKNKKL